MTKPKHYTLQCKDVFVVLRDYLDIPMTAEDKTPVRVFDASLYLFIDGAYHYMQSMDGEYESWKQFFNRASARGYCLGCDISYIKDEPQIDIEVYMEDQVNQLHAHAMFDANRNEPVSEQQLEFARVLLDMRALYLRKNAAYGNGAIGSTGLYGVAVRMSDKVHRLLTLTRSGSDGTADESITDTLLDLAVYAVIGIIVLRGKWGVDDSQ